MNRKRWLMLAAALIVAGSVLFGGVMMAHNWNFFNLETAEFKTNTHRISDGFSNISINVDTSDLRILPSEEATVSVECFEQEKRKHTVEVKDGTLIIQAEDTRAWYEHICLSFRCAQVTVYLPDAMYGTVSVSGRTADIALESLRAEALELSLSTGDITAEGVTVSGKVSASVTTGDMNLTDIRCLDFAATASTGDIRLNNAVADRAFSVQTKTGDVFLEGCDAARITLKATTGDIVGRLLSPKTFVVQTGTGDVHVPPSAAGGSCDVQTGTGDIDIDVTTP